MRTRAIVLLITAALAATGLARPAGASSNLTVPITSRVSITSTGSQAPGEYGTGERVLLDGTGRFVAFSTTAQLQADDTNGAEDVYIRDRTTNDTRRVSITDAGKQISGHSLLCGLSDDGSTVGFIGDAPNLPGGAHTQVYVRDLDTARTEMVSISSGSVAAAPAVSGSNPRIDACPISADGRFVAFPSLAGNLVPGDTNGQYDVFRRDRTAKTTQRVSVKTGGAEAHGSSGGVSMSDDGQHIVWDTNSSDLIANDTNGDLDVYVHHIVGNTTARVSLTDGDLQSTTGDSQDPQISGDGHLVVFRSNASDLTPADAVQQDDIFARDLTAGTTELIDVSSNEIQANGKNDHPMVSDDGRFVTFASAAKNLYVGDSTSGWDLYRRDRQLTSTDLVSRVNGGILAGNKSSGAPAAISDDGTVASFRSVSTNLVANDTNSSDDAFVRDFGVRLHPFGSIDAFIDQQFADFVQRPPTAAEKSTWQARLKSGDWSLDSMIDELAHGATFSGKRAPLTRLYYAYFHRTPDQGGMDYWVKKLTNDTPLAKVAASFAGSTEFKTKTGGLGTEQFVQYVYLNVLDRAPDAEGLAYWVKRLANHSKSRGDLMASFSESSEGIRHLQPPVDSVLIQLGMYQRMPTTSEFQGGVAAFGAGWAPEVLIRALRFDVSTYGGRFA
ncbi:MAG: domain protein beta Propeller [Ilumatobacteraceae bacterium]|nr:domain protein beta Propeller [Ilumatobacteraceae bacterium]